MRYWIALLGLLIPASAVLVFGYLNPRDRSLDSPIADEDLHGAAGTTFAGLSEAKQKQIWDLEHFTFELEQKFGRQVLAALQSRDHTTLDQVFRDDFAGAILTSASHDEQRGSWWSASSQVAGGDPTPTSVAADQTVICDYLWSRIGRFQEIEQASFRVLAIDADPTVQHRWNLRVLISLSGRDADSHRLAFSSTHHVQCQFVDDADIIAGRIVTRWYVTQESIRRSAVTLFREATDETGLNSIALPDNWNDQGVPRQYTFQMAVADFNLDGYPDIAVCSVDGSQFLFQSVEGKSFRNVSKQVGLPPISLDANDFLVSWIDFDNDGDADLLMAGSLYRNVDGQRFVDVTAESGLRLGNHPMGCAVADYDADGLLDLYIVYQGIGAGRHGWLEDDQSGAPNQLWRNNGGGKFADVTEQTGVGGGKRNSFAAAWLHANEDSLPDLYVANDFGTNLLFVNRGDRFEDVTSATGVGDFATSMGVAAGDINGDGDPEIYVANMYSKMGRRIIGHVCAADYPAGLYPQIQGSCAGNRLYQRKAGQAKYTELSESLGINGVGWAYAPALVDFDGDGFLDIYATTGFLSFDRGKPDG